MSFCVVYRRKYNNNSEKKIKGFKEMFLLITAKLTAVKDKLYRITQIIQDLKLENEILKQVIRRQERRLTQLEREILKNNIVIQDLADEKNEQQEELKKKKDLKGCTGKNRS